jgi:hypothetical protein
MTEAYKLDNGERIRRTSKSKSRWLLNDFAEAAMLVVLFPGFAILL